MAPSGRAELSGDVMQQKCDACGQRIVNPIIKKRCLGCRAILSVGGGRGRGLRRGAKFCTDYCRLKFWRKQRSA